MSLLRTCGVAGFDGVVMENGAARVEEAAYLAWLLSSVAPLTQLRRVQGAGSRVQGVGCRVQGAGCGMRFVGRAV